ncbi:hypothetical protein BH11BAC3_BH11BAC3_07750 [soil metagenome]
MISAIAKCSALLILIILVCTQCQTTQRANFLRKEYKSIYIDQFKLTYFRQMLIKGYNNSTAVQEIIKYDHSGFTEIILTDIDYNLIDSLTTVDNQKMLADSLNGKRRAEGAQGKRPLGFILDKLNSKWLDSLANKRYQSSYLKSNSSN